MLYVDAKELREKGCIALLDDGAFIDAMNEATMNVLDDIENLKADPTAKRVITPKFTLVSNGSRSQLGVECTVDIKLAPKKVIDITLGLEKAVDDEGRLLAYNLKEETEEAEGQQDMDGNEVVRETITLPYKADAVDADFREKDIVLNETQNDDNNGNQEAQPSQIFDATTGELIEESENNDAEPIF